jgi:hypothetical protein
MENGISSRQQIVGNNPSMASPPQRFRAHDGAASFASNLAEAGETSLKALAHRIVGVVVETLVPPEGIDTRRHVAIPAAQSAKRRDVLISDVNSGQRLGQDVLIILWICA